MIPPRIYTYATIFVLGTFFLRACLAKEEEIKKRVSDKLKRTVNVPPSYAVSMEPLMQYSQRDPLYHKRLQTSDTTGKEQSKPLDTRRSGEDQFSKRTALSDGYDVGSYYPPPYYTQPEPIIEIIIKESNDTLPTRPTPPPQPSTKEPVHVFYVKYKKNPNPKGKDDQIIYDPPIPAIVPHSSEIHIREDVKHNPKETVNYNPPSTTTLRTIIRPESETYHGSGIKVTFGNSEEAEVEEGTEQRPRVVLPPDSQHPGLGVHPAYHTDFSLKRQAYLGPPSHTAHAPSQIFNSQSNGHIPPQDTGLTQVSPNKYTSPSDEEIRQYQQEKLFLYRQSLKQQNSPHGSPALTPQQFQQPTNIPPSQLQIDFNNQKQLLRSQQDVLTNHNRHRTVNQPDHNYPRTEQIIYQQNPSYYSGFNSEQNNKNHANNPSSILNLKNTLKESSIQQGINVFEQTIVSQENQAKPASQSLPSLSLPCQNGRQFSTSLCQPQAEPIQKSSGADGEILRSVAQSEEHLVTPDYRHEFYSSLREPPKRNKLPHTKDQLQFYPVYSTAPPTGSNQYLPRISTTLNHTPPTSTPKSVSINAKPDHRQTTVTGNNENNSEQFVLPENKTALRTNIAALPNEVPEDLRAQLLSSGILNNADIQILDYDKIGDIPIESLPPEHLEHFHGAGSNPVPAVIRPDAERTESKMKRNNHHSEKSQKGTKSHIKKHPIHLDEDKYNRYLPLKVNGANFTLSDSTQLKGREVKSVVVLAPVHYDFIGVNHEGDERASKAIQVEGIRFVAGESLRELVKDPTRENYSKWLRQEKNTPSRYQSVILLITRRDEKANKSSSPEIFMYDLNSETVSKLRGELSQTFVEVAESNSSNHDLDGTDSSK